jgi:hypothetical protein
MLNNIHPEAVARYQHINNVAMRFTDFLKAPEEKRETVEILLMTENEYKNYDPESRAVLNNGIFLNFEQRIYNVMIIAVH